MSNKNAQIFFFENWLVIYQVKIDKILLRLSINIYKCSQIQNNLKKVIAAISGNLIMFI